MAEHAEIIERQVTALMTLGVDPVDAQATGDWLVARADRIPDLARGAIPAEVLESASEITPEDLIDAAADWMSSQAIPDRYKRLLHAKEIKEIAV